MTHRSSLLVAVLVPALFATTVVDRAAAQANADSLAAQVDQLIARMSRPDSPGCQCAVMHQGELVYSRALGMANLEHDIPLTPQSIIEVGSIAKGGPYDEPVRATRRADEGRAWVQARLLLVSRVA